MTKKMYLVRISANNALGYTESWMTRDAVSDLDGAGFTEQVASISPDGTVRFYLDANHNQIERVCISPGVYTAPTVPGVLDDALLCAVQVAFPGYLEGQS